MAVDCITSSNCNLMHEDTLVENPSEIAIERARNFYNLKEALTESRNEVTGLPITSISKVFIDSWDIEDIAALINELGEVVGELTS